MQEPTTTAAPAIENQLHKNNKSWFKSIEDYLPEMVYGSIDGIVTTFAVVAGASGAGSEGRCAAAGRGRRARRGATARE